MYQRLFQYQETVFKTLANQKRLEILQLLTHGELSVSEMVDMLGISQSNISQHLAVLRRSGLVQTRKQGHEVYYQITDRRITEAAALIRQFLLEQQQVGDDVLARDVQTLYPLVQDPVCGMRMSPTEVADHSKVDGTVYHFCASGCRQKFVEDPSRYKVSKTNTREAPRALS